MIWPAIAGAGIAAALGGLVGRRARRRERRMRRRLQPEAILGPERYALLQQAYQQMLGGMVPGLLREAEEARYADIAARYRAAMEEMLAERAAAMREMGLEPAPVIEPARERIALYPELAEAQRLYERAMARPRLIEAGLAIPAALERYRRELRAVARGLPSPGMEALGAGIARLLRAIPGAIGGDAT